jgi:hypothetical protein
LIRHNVCFLEKRFLSRLSRRNLFKALRGMAEEGVKLAIPWSHGGKIGFPLRWHERSPFCTKALIFCREKESCSSFGAIILFVEDTGLSVWETQITR